MASAHNWHVNYARFTPWFGVLPYMGPPNKRGLLAQLREFPDNWISNDPGITAGYGSRWVYGLLVGYYFWAGYFGYPAFRTFPYGWDVTDALAPL